MLCSSVNTLSAQLAFEAKIWQYMHFYRRWVVYVGGGGEGFWVVEYENNNRIDLPYTCALDSSTSYSPNSHSKLQQSTIVSWMHKWGMRKGATSYLLETHKAIHVYWVSWNLYNIVAISQRYFWPMLISKASWTCKREQWQKWLLSPWTSSQSEGYSRKWLFGQCVGNPCIIIIE